ncbi:MAG: ribosomal-protein-alanine acetyltransferase [Proteobacteria bacterium]|nr:MAG: ribosomal-protein-alanine acetyltransferase [Pseudomonadota bacterium]
MAEAGARALPPRIGAPAPADLDAVASLAAFASVPGWPAASIAASLGDAAAIARVARDAAGAPIAFALARLAADELEILLVAVAPAWRRCGLGRALVDALLDAAPAARAAHLEVRASNAAALALYAGAGFVAVGRRPRYYEGREDAVAMRCALAETNP